MEQATATTLEGVKNVVVTTLGIEDRAATLDASTPLLDHMPELDSMAVVDLAVTLEDHFGIEIGDDEVNGEVFETLGSLAAFVESKLG